MNREEIREKIESIHTNSQYVRVNEEHPLELYLGKNDKGYPTLRFNGNFQPVKVLGNSILGLIDENLMNSEINSQVEDAAGSIWLKTGESIYSSARL